MYFINPFGGIGNQLFMVAACVGTARTKKTSWSIDINWANAYYFRGPFNLCSQHLDTYQEEQFHYQRIKKNDVELVGYWQSRKYWTDNKGFISNLFEPNQEIAELITKKYGVILKDNTCAVHVRRGDYVGNHDNHYNLSKEYYTDLMEQYFDEFQYLIFSDDIDYCRGIFEGYNAIFINEKDIIDFFIMAQCKNFIIANSTFSWWASFLSGSDRIYAPKQWFGKNKAHFNTNDLYEDKWIVI